jgi:hypothetical protein
MTVLQEDADFLAHYGVKGMKWGQRRVERNTARIQKRLDRTARVADGTATGGDRLKTAAVQGIYTGKGAARILKRGEKQRDKIVSRRPRTEKFFKAYYGVKLSELNYHQQA